ncbi:MAG: substrate-binding domain-containing protein [Mycobacterium sp.]
MSTATMKRSRRRSWRRRLMGIAAAMVLVVPAAACGSSQESDKIVIGSVMPALNNEFWQSYLAFLETTAEQLDIELINIDANDSGDRLARGVDDLIARGVDGIIAVPFFGTGPRALASAEAEGIPIVMVDALPEDEVPGGSYEQYVGFVGPDDAESGYQMADALAQSIKPGPDGKKKIVAVQGPPGTSVAENRYDGLKRYLSEHPDLELIGSAVGNFSPVDSQNAMDDLLQRHGNDIQGVWSVAGGPTTGVLSSLKTAEMVPGEDIKIATMDLNPDVLDAVERGEVVYDNGGHWLEGGFGLVMLYDWIQGIRFGDDERNQIMSLLPVTNATIEQFRADYPGGLPDYDAKEHSRHFTPDGPPAVIELTYSKDIDLGLAP